MKHINEFIRESIDPHNSPKVKRYLKEVDNLCNKLQAEFGKYARIESGSNQGGYEVEIDIYKDADTNMKSFESIFADIFGTTYEGCCQNMDLEPEEGCEYSIFWDNAYVDDNEIDLSCLADSPDYNDMLANVPCLVALITASVAIMPIGTNAARKCDEIIDDFVMKVSKI